MEESNRRKDYRVLVPGELIEELALWPCPEQEYVRLGVERLGRPEFALSSRGPGSLAVSDLSIRGMGLLVSAPDELPPGLAGATALFAYMRLADPDSWDPHGVLSVFVYCSLVRTARQGGSLFLALRFLRFAVASRLDKSLDFLDAQSCGVNSLARWCDNVARGLYHPEALKRPGLDMDDLLGEIERALSSPGGAPKES